MPFAIELYLDECADRSVRRIWAELDANGVRSLGSLPDADYHPHVSLTVFDDGDTTRIADAVRPLLDDAMGLPLTLEPLGFFLTREAPAFLGVVPTTELLTLHHAVCQAVEPYAAGLWPQYRPGALLPHCTLAIHVTNNAAVIDAVSAFPTPIPAHAASAHLVEISSGRTRAPLTTT